MAFTPRGGSRGGSRGGFGGSRGYFLFHYLRFSDHIDNKLGVAVAVSATGEDEEVDVLDWEAGEPLEVVELVNGAVEVEHVVEGEQGGDPELLLSPIDMLVRLIFQFLLTGRCVRS